MDLRVFGGIDHLTVLKTCMVIILVNVTLTNQLQSHNASLYKDLLKIKLCNNGTLNIH